LIAIRDSRIASAVIGLETEGRVRRWLNNDSFQAYAGSAARVVINESSDDTEYFGAAVLFTGKCDNCGGWKIVDSRLLSDAEDEKINKEDE
jgi:hypothetical protein